ncbi:MAG: hypothetical protein RQ739_09600 [Desulfotignum sp.]|jgi:hypothetical protein|nr:hypothetical protein [Desulfotignum sp.]
MNKRVIFFVFVMATICFSAFSVWGADQEEKKCGQTLTQNKATEDIYVDMATMHRYVKNPDGTYCEYDRTGKFLQTVSSELPLLTKRPHVIAVRSNCYLLYAKKPGLDTDHPVTIRPAGEPHPEGWFLEKALVDLRHISY